MKHLFMWSTILLCLGFGFCCCSSDDQTPAAGNTITISESKFSISGEGGELSLHIEASSDWGIYATDKWVKCSPTGGVSGGHDVVLSVEKNPSQEQSRTTTVTVKSGEVRQSVSIEQRPFVEVLPIEDAALRERLVAQCDKNGDGLVSRVEAASVTVLDISGLNLKSLDILSWFPNLEVLNCSNNQLKSIDLSLYPKLEELDCSNNQIEELNIRESDLQVLNAEGNPLQKLYVPSDFTLPAGFSLPADCEIVEPDIFTPEGYTLTWSDEFEAAELNRGDWTPEIGRGDNGWGNNELQYYTDRAENLRLEDGKLVITAIKENYSGSPVTSARLITKNKVKFLYGYVVASIKLPKTANGLWPAFWMMGNDFDQVGWPRCGETDILEMGHSGGISNGTQERFLNGAMHWGPAWNKHEYYSYNYTHSYSVQDGEFHTFTCIWDEQQVAMYIDLEKSPNAKPYFVMDIAAANVKEYFHKENFLLLNLAVGGNFPGIHDINKVTALNSGPARMEVDYVRVFQK